MMMKNGSALLLALSLSTLAACGNDQPQNITADNHVAGLQTEQGRIDIFEPEPGRLITVGTDIDVTKEAPQALFERLSGAPAPAELVAAQRRADSMPKAAPQISKAAVAEAAADLIGKRIGAVDGIGINASALSAADFQAAYCPGSGYDFYYCWLSRTGSGSIERSSVTYIKTYLNVYSGSSVTLKLAHKNFWGDWVTDVSTDVLLNHTSWISTTANDTYKVSTSNASGDGYHWSTFGNL